MSHKKLKRKTLSEKITETFAPCPLADPENDVEDETIAKFAEIDEDEDYDRGEKQLSEFRKRNVKVLSEFSDKYKGKLSSRKELLTEDEEESDAEESEAVATDDDENLEKYRRKLKNCQLGSEPDESLGTDEDVGEEVSDDSEDNGDDDSDYESPSEDLSEPESGSEQLDKTELLKESDNSVNIKKGLAVQSQLKVWEKLLEVRIHSQKMLIKANSLPEPDQYEKLRSASEEFMNLAEETRENVTKLLEKMIEIRTSLTLQFPETRNLLQPKKRASSSGDLEMEPPIKKYGSLLHSNFEDFRGYRNSVLQKWHDRTKILTPGSSKGNRNDFDVIKKIEASLLNKSDLVRKSQILKGNYKLFYRGEAAEGRCEPVADNVEQESVSTSPEIYDDTDFYHQQLRELIEFKANTAATPSEMTKQLADLQKLRHKMKKKVDTRASKGRKIRYVVHNKLVNFMSPYDNSEWTDESKNELYRSLFTT